jgi:hypothetical protein
LSQGHAPPPDLSRMAETFKPWARRTSAAWHSFSRRRPSNRWGASS